jgi:tyrosyl-tRNA synthetase
LNHSPDLLHQRRRGCEPPLCAVGQFMSAYKSELLNVLASRGFINQVSEPEAMDALALKSTVTAYIGFDCTAPSLHVGSLLPIMMLYWLQQTGHRPIALMGGGTTRVGDPSGKDESRRLLTDETIAQNLRGIRANFANFLKFEDAGGNAIMANNADWLNTLNYIDFLRDIGRHFSINRMLAFDSVKLRLERQQELSFLEFNYMILQAYDFVELHRRYSCVLQMGGSDQWGNIINGIELGRRMLKAGLFALTSPLITTSSGSKMGKTASGAIWLDPRMTSQYDFWQYWRNVDDADVIRFLKLFTMIPLSEIERLAELRFEEINEAKKILATEVTKRVHGLEITQAIARTAQETFEKGQMGSELPTLAVFVGESILTANTHLGFTSSNAVARQLVKDGAVFLGDHQITDISYKIRAEDFGQEGRVLLRLGSRKRGILVRKSE